MRWFFIIIFLLGGATKSFSNPMESLLKKQITQQRYLEIEKDRKRKATAAKKAKRAAQPKPIKAQRTYRQPPYKILLIAGRAKKLVAHMQTAPDLAPILVRVGDRVDYENMTFRVVLINERCLILKRGSRRYEIPFITP